MKAETDLSSIKSMIAPFRKVKNVYYASDVNMNYSFDSLKNLIEVEMRTKLNEGDVFVCDSANGRSRKALIRSKEGWLILYFRRDKKSKRLIQEVHSVR